MPPKESMKRKDPPQGSGGQGRNPKRNKVQESRSILAQPAHRVLNDNGELDVGSFVKSRQFEIEALEQGIKNSKHGLSQRAFQQVPRQLRRRTASHNVKKIPKRLRARAAKEIKDDNTPTGSARKKDLTSKQHIRRETAEKAARIGAKAKQQREALAKAQADENAGTADEGEDTDMDDAESTANVLKGSEAPAAIQPVHAPSHKRDVLSKPSRPVTKFRKRQKDKTWLPTHIFHAKRAHMTLPAEPLWRFVLPLSPTEKAYRTTHRAANLRGCIACDMSYMSTILLEGTEHSLLNTFKRMGVPREHFEGKKGEKWRQGTRSWSGWLKDPSNQHLITTTLVVWCVADEAPLMNLDDDITELEPARRTVLLRTHPAGFLQLWNEVLKVAKEQRPAVKVEDLRFDIGSIEIEGPQATEALAGILHELPRKKLGAQITSGVHWPTLGRATAASLPQGALLNLTLADPRLRHPPRPVDVGSVTEERLLELMAQWPGDKASVPGQIFDREARHASCTLQASQKAINRRKGDAMLGEHPKELSSDPRIPAMLCASAGDSNSTRRNAWTLLLPWNWVLPFWYSLVYYPLSTGGNPLFGGLNEKRQLCFEYNEPWSPADYPGTQAGWNWELGEQVRRQQDWKKRPKGKRTEFASADLGNGEKGELGRGWACDWEYLFDLPLAAEPVATDKKSEVARGQAQQSKNDMQSGKRVNVPEGVVQVLGKQLDDPSYIPIERTLLTVSLRLLHRGVPKTCSRIYRLPMQNQTLREEWMALAEVRSGNKSQPRAQRSTQHKAYASESGHSEESPRYPSTPDADDLIGFVTTGNFNLGEGKGTGIGSIALARVWSDEDKQNSRARKGLCIVREAGASVARLAEWSAI